MEKNSGGLLRGNIDTIVLRLLYEGDRYGYDIIKEIELKTKGEYKIKQATLYSSLRRLEEQGFTGSYWGEKTSGSRKKYYTLTEMGKEVFLQSKTEWIKSKDLFDNLVLKAETEIKEEINEQAETKAETKNEIEKEAIYIEEIESPLLEEKNEDSLEDIYFKAKQDLSYVDNVMSEAYKPEKTIKSDSIEYEDEIPFIELLEKEQQVEEIIAEEKEKDEDIESEIKQKNIEFIKYGSKISQEKEMIDKEIINRDYQSILSKLIKPSKKIEPNTTQKLQDKKLDEVKSDSKQMGDEVIIRRHNTEMKEYNSENYFYKNRLMLTQYAILFLFMIIQICATFFINEIIIRKGMPIQRLDLWIYIGAVIFALMFPLIAFICSFKNYYKRKQIEQSFKSLILFRFILLVNLFLIIPCINVLMHILSSNFIDYLARFVLPMILSFNVIWDLLIYIILVKSKKYNVQG